MLNIILGFTCSDGNTPIHYAYETTYPPAEYESVATTYDDSRLVVFIICIPQA